MKTLSIVIALVVALGLVTGATAGGGSKHYLQVTLKDAF